MRHLCEHDQIVILDKIETVYSTVKTRLLPTFDSIDNEAKEIENERLKELGQRFNPDYMDESDVFDDAFHKGVDHYIVHTEMKKEFIKSAVTWIFHLFEKDCTYIFETKDGNTKKDLLTSLSIDTAKGSSWYKCNNELRLLANSIKHGEGRSLDELKLERPDYFNSTISFLSNNDIELTIDNLEEYVNEMKKFWDSLFEICLR